MDRTDALFAATVGGIVVGLVVLLYGEASSSKPFVFGGSAIVVVAVGLLAAVVGGLDDASAGSHS